MIVILSPSKTQDFEHENRTEIHTQPEFMLDTKELLESIQQKEIDELQQVMQVSERLAFLNYNRFQDIEGLEADTLTDEELHFAQANLRIISGFYGILRPFDLIQPYRLEMKTPLKTKRGKNLYEFWGKFLTDYFNTRYSDDIIINLASQEYAKAIMNRHFKLKAITPIFKEEQDGELKTVAIYAKRARGKMARYIIQNKIKQPSKLKFFEEEGYKLDEELSSSTEWIFTRPRPEKIEEQKPTEPKKRGRKPKSTTSTGEEE